MEQYVVAPVRLRTGAGGRVHHVRDILVALCAAHTSDANIAFY